MLKILRLVEFFYITLIYKGRNFSNFIKINFSSFIKTGFINSNDFERFI